MSRESVTANDCTATSLATYDVVLLDHADLDTFVTTVGGATALPSGTTVFTEDAYTSGTVEFNLIVFSDDDDTYGTATQLHHPFTTDDTVLDLRGDVDASFAEYLLGHL